jgi:hypothetical protein
MGTEPSVRTNTGTDASGAYTLSDLIPGRYQVLFSRSGYHPRRRQMELTAPEPVRLDVQLPPR